MLILNHFTLPKKVACVDKIEIDNSILGEELTLSLNKLAILITDFKPQVKRIFHPTSIFIFKDNIYIQISSLGSVVKLKSFDEVKSYIDDWMFTFLKENEK